MPKVAVGILIKNEKNSQEVRSSECLIMLCQRLKNANYALKWEFPGGKLESGENPEQALVRELFEEMGITVEEFSRYFIQEHTFPDGRIFEVYYFLITRYKGIMCNNAFESMQWVHVKALPDYDLLQGNRDVVQKLIDEYAND